MARASESDENSDPIAYRDIARERETDSRIESSSRETSPGWAVASYNPPVLKGTVPCNSIFEGLQPPAEFFTGRTPGTSGTHLASQGLSHTRRLKSKTSALEGRLA